MLSRFASTRRWIHFCHQPTPRRFPAQQRWKHGRPALLPPMPTKKDNKVQTASFLRSSKKREKKRDEKAIPVFDPLLEEDEPILADTAGKQTIYKNDNPKEILNNLFITNTNLLEGLSSWLELTEIEQDYYWTATFTCPLTGIVVDAGTLRGFEEATKVVDDRVLYTESSLAGHAAAARFLDNLNFTRTGDAEPRYCEETPVLIDNKAIEQLFTTGAKTGRRKNFPKSTLHTLCYNQTEFAKGFWVRALETTEVEDGFWTAKFTCPLTGIVAESGTMRDLKEATKVVDGRVLYTKETLAGHAAAARFLDQINFTRTGEAEPRLCEETPVKMDNKAIEQLFPTPVDNDTVREQTRTGNPKQILNNLFQEQTDLQGLASWLKFTEVEKGHWTATFTCPLTGIRIKAGTLRGAKEATKVVDRRVLYENKTLAGSAAAARFLDYLNYTRTGEMEPRFCEERPVRIRNRAIEKLFTTDTDEEDATILDTTTGSDIFNFSPSSQSKEKGPSLLQSTPSSSFNFLVKDATTITSPEPGKLATTLPPASQILSATNLAKDASTPKATSPEPPLGKLTTTTFPASQILSATKTVPADPLKATTPEIQQGATTSYQEHEGDEELTIQHVSGMKAAGGSTLERVMEAWGESVVTPMRGSEKSTASSLEGPMLSTPAQQKERMIADSISWSKRLRKQEKNRGYQVFETTTLPVTLRSANAALRALAKAHRSLPSQDVETNQRVEAAAKQIVDLMRVADSADVDVCNSYLKCLGRSSPKEAAHAAENMLVSMMEREEVLGKVLPEPNIDTFNTVIQLYAIAGGDYGVENCEKIYDMIQQGKDRGLDLHPNRTTFLSVLSSLARPLSPDGVSAFNRERAQGWIDRMRTLGEETGDETLVPDTEVFNAPLRWSGGMESTRSRGFIQGLAWDEYNDVFGENFRSDQESPAKVEARLIEEWLLEMESIGPAPDVETFEAAIQAWTRCGTADGLRRAELVARRAMASNKIRPRLQTFHPILAGWALSGDERGPGKVQEWFERLEENSRTSPGMKTDARIHTCMMIARRSYQKKLLDSVDENTGTADESISTASQIAASCEADLIQIYEHFVAELKNDTVSDDGMVVDPVVFSHVICAQGGVAVAKVKALSSGYQAIDGIAKELKSMRDTVKKYDECTQLLRAKHAKLSTRIPHLKVQLRQFEVHAQTIYLNVLSILNELDRQLENFGARTNAESFAFAQNLYEAETILRRSEELRNVVHAQSPPGTSIGENNLVYDDLFVYPSQISDMASDKNFLGKQLALYIEILEGCERILSCPELCNESVRICMVLTDLLGTFLVPDTRGSADCTLIFQTVLGIAEKHVPNKMERSHILRRLNNNALSISNRAENEGSAITVDLLSLIRTKLKAAKASSSTDVSSSGSSGGRKRTTRARRGSPRQRWRTAS